MVSISDTLEVNITRSEASFDRACDEAYQLAVGLFEIDEYGHSSRVRDWERSCCTIEVGFLQYSRTGSRHLYEFSATAVKEDDE